MENKRALIVAGCLFLLFAVFTAAVLLVDVQPIGPNGSSVGLAGINQFVFKQVGVHPFWYDVTEYLGLAALACAAGFAALGMAQMIRRRSILKVDVQILLLGVFYAMMAGVYIFFECVIVNYRPVILQTDLEASYPSSHVMLVVCIMATAMIEFRRLFAGRKALCRMLEGVCMLIIAATVFGRLLSGVHWFTDIIAGILISAAQVMLYSSAVQCAEKRK